MRLRLTTILAHILNSAKISTEHHLEKKGSTLRHLLLYRQSTDIPFFVQIQAESIYNEEIRKNAEWCEAHPFRKLIQNPPDLHKTRMPVGSLGYGFCLGIVFFIFKMLYSDQPDGGLFWAAGYNKYLSDPLLHRTKIGGKDEIEFNPLMDDFLIFLIRTSHIAFSQRELGHINDLSSVFNSERETRALSSELGLTERKIGLSRAILESKKRLLENLYEQWKESIIKFSLSSEISMPMGQEPLNIHRLMSALHPKKIKVYNPRLFPLLFQGINSIPPLFWFFIHHFAYINDPKNVCLPFLNKVMDLQVMNVNRTRNGCTPHLEDLVSISPAIAKIFEGDLHKTNQVILYDKCLRLQIGKNPSFEEICVFCRNDLTIYFGRTNNKTINTIDSAILVAKGQYQLSKIPAYDGYRMSYFMNIITDNRKGNDKGGGYSHIICCWEEISGMPSGVIQTKVFIFDPNNGLWQLDLGESVGAAIVNLILTNQMDSTQSKLCTVITFFRGL